MLTEDEMRGLALLAQAWELFTVITADGPGRVGDLAEAAAHVHALQNMLLSQSAARVYPQRYRLLGGPTL